MATPSITNTFHQHHSDSVAQTKLLAVTDFGYKPQFMRFWWQVYWNGLPFPPPECQRIEAFKLWCWRRLLKVPWTARRSNQSILSEINTEYSLEELRLKLKLQHFCQMMQKPTHWKNPRFWERLRAEGEGWDGWMASPMQWTWTWANFGNWWGAGRPWGRKESDTTGWLKNNNGL